MSLQYWLCERIAIIEPRKEMTAKTPRAVRWDLYQLECALNGIDDLAKIQQDKVSINIFVNLSYVAFIVSYDLT